MTYLEELQHAIKAVHGVQTRHLASTPHEEVFRGKAVWKGDVEVFEVLDHPKANRVYAWGYYPTKTASHREVVTVLGLPPVVSVKIAVKVGIAGVIKMGRS